MSWRCICCSRGAEVTILEAKPGILCGGAPLPHMNREMLEDLLRWHGARVLTGTQILRADGASVECRTADGTTQIIHGTELICAVGYVPEDALYGLYSKGKAEIYKIGDCRQVRNIMGAIWDAYEIARRI